MIFLWPHLLWLLLTVPVIVGAYLYLLRQKKRAVARYSNLSMLREAMSSSSPLRRHMPPVVFLFALVAMIVAIARPAAVVTLPSQHETVILAMDVSGSMRATDVEPNRLVAAQAAARTFVAAQPRSTRIGVVAFAATALVVQHPTQNREDIVSAIERLQLQRGTAVGSALIVALGALFPGEGITVESVMGGSEQRRKPVAATNDLPSGASKPPEKAVAPGSHGSAAIILLTDGQRTTGPDPLEAARIAAERGVRVYTVGVGTPDGEIMSVDGWRMRVRLDEDTLKNVSNITHGQYFYAANASDLKKVYQALQSRFVLEKKETEVTAAFSAFAALLAVTSVLLSLLWFNRIL